MKPAIISMRQKTCGGFSLIEMIVAITVLGILSASAAVFLRGPIASYFDAERRADLSDAGGLAMAKLSQEISRAVPNSVRVTTVGTSFYLEFLPVRSEGRYRIAGPGNVFNVSNTVFDALTPVQVQTADFIVANNYLATPGVNDVWVGNPRASYTGPNGNVTALTFSPHTFSPPEPPPLPVLPNAPEHRFQIATQPVTYVCDPAVGTLRRYSGYAILAAQPVNAAGAPLAGAQNDLLATGIATCQAAQYPGTLRRAQVVALALNFDNAGDRLNLAHTIRVEPLP